MFYIMIHHYEDAQMCMHQFMMMKESYFQLKLLKNGKWLKKFFNSFMAESEEGHECCGRHKDGGCCHENDEDHECCGGHHDDDHECCKKNGDHECCKDN